MTVLLLMTANTYRARPFAAAARRVGLDILWGVDTPEELADTAGVPLAVDFRRPDSAVETIVDCAQRRPLQAILALDDAASLIAARASLALGLPHNDPDAALAARDKLTMRRALQAGGVPCPHFEAFALDSDPAALAATVRYPCVLKPLLLNGSRGVIRANDKQEFVAAWKQVLTV
ncbi:MAG: acetyl-CoA carboxylase biotin carboxylase subunit family protein, partial [Anaerolineales bacterium]